MTSSEPSESFQIPIEAAEAYEATFVPAFFAQWAPILCDATGLSVGVNGSSTSPAGPESSPGPRPAAYAPAVPVGVDLNEAMLHRGSPSFYSNSLIDVVGEDQRHPHQDRQRHAGAGS